RDARAVLTDLNVAFVTDNLRAVVTEVSAKRNDDRQSDDAVTSSDGPIGKRADSNLELRWKVDNPDKDELRYRLRYRMLGSNTWYDILKPKEKLTKENYTWDTSHLSAGRYRVLVIATDELSNPPELVTKSELESGVLVIDNSPPVVDGLKLVGKRLQAVVLDGVGPIQRVEVSVARSEERRVGEEWRRGGGTEW